MTPRARPAIDRVMARVVKTDTCWLWTGTPNSKGYGCLMVGGRNGVRRPVHAVTWEEINGPVPKGLELDHLCRVRNCVRPDHLEAVTHLENLHRRPGFSLTECRQGHAMAGDNLIIAKQAGRGPSRRCRACSLISQRRSRAKRARAANPNQEVLAS